jgi:hypothetical protein
MYPSHLGVGSEFDGEDILTALDEKKHRSN